MFIMLMPEHKSVLSFFSNDISKCVNVSLNENKCTVFWHFAEVYSRGGPLKIIQLVIVMAWHGPSSPWWRHQMETFSALLAVCAGNSPVPGEFPTQKPVTRSFDVYFDLRPNKRLSKQLWGWWFETQSRPLWRHRNELLHKPMYV